jgi:translation initiation factor IF-1
MTSDGTVVELLPGALVRVKLDEGQEITAHVAEELKRVGVPVKPGDRVAVRKGGMDPTRGSIVGAIR